MAFIEDKPFRINQLAKRNIERQLNVQKNRDNKELCTADNEKLTTFEKIFYEKYDEIFNLFSETGSIQKLNLPDHFNDISKNILALQKYVAASSLFLRNYDVQKYNQLLQELTIKAKTSEDEYLPKKKFGFKNKNKIVQARVNGHGKDVVDFKEKKILDIKENLCGFADRVGDKICMRQSDIFKKDVTLERLENCHITLLGCPSTLHLNHINNCTILSGPVSTSIFAENCQNSTLSIACQQLRLHSSNNITIFLHVTSRAIMEDCTNIIFGPYNFHYEDKEKDFSLAGLDIKVNNWKCIDDFNWLNVEKPSPNWREYVSSDDSA